jgi:2'-5' RNA ligase
VVNDEVRQPRTVPGSDPVCLPGGGPRASVRRAVSVFLAIDLDDATRAQAAAIIDTARTRIDARWVRADKLHLTLVFLGNPTPEQVDTFRSDVDAIASRHSAFALSLRGAGTFGTARAPSVLWLGVDGDLEVLTRLQLDAKDTLLQYDLSGVQPLERERPYAPHVTLARSKAGLPFDALEASLADFSTAPFRASHLTLYESTASEYRPLHRAALG